MSKRSYKPRPGIVVSQKCAKCSTVIGRVVTGLSDFRRIVERQGWKRLDYDKSEEVAALSPETEYPDTVHGTCCKACVEKHEAALSKLKPAKAKPKAKTTKLSAEEAAVTGNSDAKEYELTETVVNPV
jgi:hypothetical protein